MESTITFVHQSFECVWEILEAVFFLFLRTQGEQPADVSSSWPYKAVGYIYLGACSLHCWEDWGSDRLTKEHFIWDVWVWIKTKNEQHSWICNPYSFFGQVWESLMRANSGNDSSTMEKLIPGLVWWRLITQELKALKTISKDVFFLPSKMLNCHFWWGGERVWWSDVRKGCTQEAPYLRLWLSFLPVQVSPEHL